MTSDGSDGRDATRPISIGELAARGMAVITGVGVFGEGSHLRLVVRVDGVAYLFQGPALEAIPLRASPTLVDLDDEGVRDAPDDDDEEDEGDDDEDDEDFAALWDLEGEPEDQEEINRLIEGPTMEPLVASFVLRPARPVVPIVPVDDASPATAAPAKTQPTGRPDSTSDRLCVVDERTGLMILEVGLEEYLAPGSQRQVLPISSGGVSVLPNTQVQITTRPQHSSFRPERLVIGGTAGDWIVNDIRVGTRGQLSHSGDLPGELFAATAMDAAMLLEVVGPGEDLVLTVTYVGPSPEGAVFLGAFLGAVADSLVRAHCLAVRWIPEGVRQGWMIGLTGDDELADLDATGRAVAVAAEAPAVLASSG